ncbi:MAG TPA: PIG-L family deacetylase [Syntrophobacteraceae bacterium]|nr:PIG-L family deacetylase [Syntrophobacteraceae bacterium]
MNVLVVAAHPDDEVLGCGGTIARLSREGHAIDVAILGEGITSRYRARDDADAATVEALHERSREVARLLGVRDLSLHNLPDNRFDTVPLLDIVKIVEDLVSRFRPEVILTHHGDDLNVDHAIAFRAVLTATRPVIAMPVKEIHAFEVPSSTEWAFGRLHRGFRPNVFVNITTTTAAKIQAMRVYESEVRAFPHPRSPEALQALARYRGSSSGCEAAEAFELIRWVR